MTNILFDEEPFVICQKCYKPITKDEARFNFSGVILCFDCMTHMTADERKQFVNNKLQEIKDKASILHVNDNKLKGIMIPKINYREFFTKGDYGHICKICLTHIIPDGSNGRLITAKMRTHILLAHPDVYSRKIEKLGIRVGKDELQKTL